MWSAGRGPSYFTRQQLSLAWGEGGAVHTQSEEIAFEEILKVEDARLLLVLGSPKGGYIRPPVDHLRDFLCYFFSHKGRIQQHVVTQPLLFVPVMMCRVKAVQHT